MAEEAPLEIVKRGETSLTVSLVRSAGGLTVSVKAHPAVEAFMRGLGSGEHLDVRAAGPYWRTVNRDASPLQVYALTEDVPPVRLDGGGAAVIARVGQPLLDLTARLDGRSEFVVNLSFLRLVGISEGAGVTFAVRGVHTYEALAKMKDMLGEGYKRFYRQYMKPLKMDIVVSTQESLL